MSEDQAETLFGHGELVECTTGQIVYQKGDPVKYVYVVLHGSCSIKVESEAYGNCPVTLSTAFDGDTFGESLEDNIRDTFVACDEPCCLLAVETALHNRVMRGAVRLQGEKEAVNMAHTLKTAPFFQNIGVANLTPILSSCRVIELRYGDCPVTTLTSPSDCLYLLCSGLCKVLLPNPQYYRRLPDKGCLTTSPQSTILPQRRPRTRSVCRTIAAPSPSVGSNFSSRSCSRNGGMSESLQRLFSISALVHHPPLATSHTPESFRPPQQSILPCHERERPAPRQSWHNPVSSGGDNRPQSADPFSKSQCLQGRVLAPTSSPPLPVRMPSPAEAVRCLLRQHQSIDKLRFRDDSNPRQSIRYTRSSMHRPCSSAATEPASRDESSPSTPCPSLYLYCNRQMPPHNTNNSRESIAVPENNKDSSSKRDARDRNKTDRDCSTPYSVPSCHSPRPLSTDRTTRPPSSRYCGSEASYSPRWSPPHTFRNSNPKDNSQLTSSSPGTPSVKDKSFLNKSHFSRSRNSKTASLGLSHTEGHTDDKRTLPAKQKTVQPHPVGRKQNIPVDVFVEMQPWASTLRPNPNPTRRNKLRDGQDDKTKGIKTDDPQGGRISRRSDEGPVAKSAEGQFTATVRHCVRQRDRLSAGAVQSQSVAERSSQKQPKVKARNRSLSTASGSISRASAASIAGASGPASLVHRKPGRKSRSASPGGRYFCREVYNSLGSFTGRASPDVGYHDDRDINMRRCRLLKAKGHAHSTSEPKLTLYNSSQSRHSPPLLSDCIHPFSHLVFPPPSCTPSCFSSCSSSHLHSLHVTHRKTDTTHNLHTSSSTNPVSPAGIPILSSDAHQHSDNRPPQQQHADPPTGSREGQVELLTLRSGDFWGKEAVVGRDREGIIGGSLSSREQGEEVRLGRLERIGGAKLVVKVASRVAVVVAVPAKSIALLADEDRSSVLSYIRGAPDVTRLSDAELTERLKRIDRWPRYKDKLLREIQRCRPRNLVCPECPGVPSVFCRNSSRQR
eukprot:GHVQ01024641.1.p1 GENE.GHVQ01024641.1~~GHVQ01024641.1.p1  ORF type:complete len:1011 (+),score=164.74 GHVQ01024641.1:2736-5768(+)